MTEVKQNNIPVELVQKLRASSGAGVLDCKKALIETNGDIVIYLLTGIPQISNIIQN